MNLRISETSESESTGRMMIIPESPRRLSSDSEGGLRLPGSHGARRGPASVRPSAPGTGSGPGPGEPERPRAPGRGAAAPRARGAATNTAGPGPGTCQARVTVALALELDHRVT